MEPQSARSLHGVFANRSSAEGTIEQLRRAGISEKQVRIFSKSVGYRLLHLLSGQSDDAEALERELRLTGCAPDEASFYRREYEAGHTLLIVYPGPYQERARAVLNSNAAYTYAQYRQQHEAPRVPPHGRATDGGAITPGMRPDDSSQDGIATTADGIQAADIDPALIEADLQHLNRIFNEQPRQQ